MKRKNTTILLIAFVITLAVSGLAQGQDSVALSVAPTELYALETGGISEGQKVKVEGIVINRDDQSFTVRDAKGTEVVVVLTDKTVIKKEYKGWFHRDKSSSADDIRCGLRLKVEGRGNSDGQVVAKNITIDQLDLKTAENNQTRFPEPEWRLDQEVQNAAILWTIQPVEHCGKCSSHWGQDCATNGCRSRGCTGHGGCN